MEEHRGKTGADMRRGIISVTIASILFGLNPVLIAGVSADGMDSASLVFWMYVVNCAVNALLWRCGGRRGPRLHKRQIALSFFWGMVGMGWTGYLLTTSYGLIGTGVSTVLHFTYPAFVTLVTAVLFGRRVRRGQPAAVLMSIAGIVLTTGASSAEKGAAAFIPAILSAVTYGSYLIANECRAFKGIPAAAKCTFMTAGVWMSFGAALLAGSGPAFPSGAGQAGRILLIGCSSAAGYNALVRGVSEIGAVRGAFATLLEPLTSMAVSVLLKGEAFTWGKAAGSLVILLAVLQNLRAGEAGHGFKRHFSVQKQAPEGAGRTGVPGPDFSPGPGPSGGGAAKTAQLDSGGKD